MFDTDIRVVAARKGAWYYHFYPGSMEVEASVETWNDDDEDVLLTARFPVKWVVCPTCEGHGKHVNPSIDAHGLTQNDFDEDPEFAREYFSGAYDVTCYECKGKRVVLERDEDAPLTEEQSAVLQAMRDKAQAEAEYEAERAAEMRYCYGY